MTVPAGSAISDSFRCEALSGALSYRTCIIRQSARAAVNGGQDVMTHPDCQVCEEGRTIKEHFGDVAPKHKLFRASGRKAVASRPGKPKEEKKDMAEQKVLKPKHKKCSQEGCEKFAAKSGMCIMHWRLASGQTSSGRGRATKKCPNCGAAASSNVSPKCLGCGYLFTSKALLRDAKKLQEKLPPQDTHAPAAPRGDVVRQLLMKKLDLEQKIAAIDTAIEVIRDLAGEAA